jgi:hypothetical protein
MTEIRTELGFGVLANLAIVIPVYVPFLSPVLIILLGTSSVSDTTATICRIIGIAEIFYCVLSYNIFREFGWTIWKKIGADRRVKKMYLYYQSKFALTHGQSSEDLTKTEHSLRLHSQGEPLCIPSLFA